MSSIFPLSLAVDLLHLPDNLKKSCPSRNPICFQRRRNSKTDRLRCPLRIGYNQIRRKRIQIPFLALHRSIERFQINCYITACLLRHSLHLLTLFKRTYVLFPIILYFFADHKITTIDFLSSWIFRSTFPSILGTIPVLEYCHILNLYGVCGSSS